jgi:hypothetical protein
MATICSYVARMCIHVVLKCAPWSLFRREKGKRNISLSMSSEKARIDISRLLQRLLSSIRRPPPKRALDLDKPTIILQAMPQILQFSVPFTPSGLLWRYPPGLSLDTHQPMAQVFPNCPDPRFPFGFWTRVEDMACKGPVIFQEVWFFLKCAIVYCGLRGATAGSPRSG